MSTAPTAQPPQPPAEKPKPELSQPQRILNTFFEPRKTFTDLPRGTAWWMAWLLIALVSVGFVFAIDRNIGFEQVMENNMKLASASQLEQFEKMPPEQRARVMEMQVKGTKYFSYVFPIGWTIMMLIVAAVLMATFRFGAGATVGFGVSLAIVIYASLPGIIRTLLATITIAAGKDPETFFIQNPVATNLGYFIDPVQHKFLYSLASAVDIFMIWTLVLTAIGFTCVSKVKSGASYAIVFGWYVVFTLAMAGLGAAF